MEGYKEKTISGSSTVLQGGTTTQAYDANGYLVGITDSTLGAKNRTFVNDAAGRALMVNQGGNIQRQLIVNGEVLGRYGTMVDDKNPQTQGTPNFVTKADFNFSFKPIDGTYPRATPSAVTVAEGDTLQNIAKNVYGDSALWYLIADANGLSGNADLTVGQALSIPSRVSSASGANTFTPYNASKVIGDTSPNLPQPVAQAQGGGGGGCGGFGTILMIVVIAVVTIYTAGALSAAAGSSFSTIMASGASAMIGGGTAVIGGVSATVGFSAATVGAAMLGAAVGSIAGQGVAMAMGMQKEFSWNQVGVSALTAGITAGVGGILGPVTSDTSWYNLAGRAALSTGLSQGIGDQLGMGVKFSWTNVAMAAVSSGVNSAVKANTPFNDSRYGLFNDTMNGFATGMTMNALRGGQMTPAQVATDAFGNALGNSIVGAMQAREASQQEAKVKENTRTAMNAAGIDYAINKDGEIETASPYTKDTVEKLVRKGHAPENIAAVLNDPAMRGQILERTEVLPDGRLARYQESGAVTYSVRSPEIVESTEQLPFGADSPEPLPRRAGVGAIETLLSPVISAGTALSEYQAKHPNQMQMLSIAAEGVQLAVGGPARYLFSKAADAVFGEIRGAIRQEVQDRATGFFKEQGFGDEYAGLLGNGVAFASDLVLASGGKQILDGANRVGQAATTYAKGPQNAGRGAPVYSRWVNEKGHTVYSNRDGSVIYQRKDGVAVTYRKAADGNAYPDFTPYAKKTVQIDEPFARGTSNYRAANEKAGLKDLGGGTLEGYTWHHHQDGKTMQLVPIDINKEFSHYGGVSNTKKN